jgi:hypothetical protein
MKYRILVFVVLVIMVLPATFGTVQGADAYISDPSRIRMFDNIKTLEIETGESGTFRLTIENRYKLDMTNIVLTIGIYGVGTSYQYKDISDVEHPPTINGEVEHEINIPPIENDTQAFVNFTIKAQQETHQGTYFVRFNLSFQYNGTTYIMKSRGYFSESEWETATSQADENDPGRIDIDSLGVDGIIPDSSFLVKDPIPQWPLYLCVIPIIVVLGVLALLFYCQEQYNMFPWLDQGFKYWSGKLHQSWRLLKHRFRKA